MFVADKEGKRISKHDKLRLYEHRAQFLGSCSRSAARLLLGLGLYDLSSHEIVGLRDKGFK